MRLFAAARLPHDVRAHVEARVAPLREALPDWRWVRPEQWHLTLAFFGEVDEPRVAELDRRISRAAGRHSPFSLRLGGLGAFGSARRATVLWVGIEGDRGAVRALTGSVAAGGRRTGIAMEERRYRPHVTLARHRTPVDLSGTDALGRDCTGPTWSVTDFVLVESRLGPQVEHLERARYRLGPA